MGTWKGTNPIARYLWGPLLPSVIGSSAFGTAGEVYLAPINVPWPIIIDRIIYEVGAAQAGNVRAGIYREGAAADSPQGAVLVVESASVAQSSAYSIQMVTVADTVLTPDQYFIGVQGSDTTGTFFKSGDSALALASFYNRAGGYGAFTDPCPAISGHSKLIFIGLRIKENYPAAGGW